MLDNKFEFLSPLSITRLIHKNIQLMYERNNQRSIIFISNGSRRNHDHLASWETGFNRVENKSTRVKIWSLAEIKRAMMTIQSERSN